MEFKTANNAGFKKRVRNLIHDRETFKSLIDRERKRADRYNNYFSLLELHFDPSQNSGPVHSLITALKKRIRAVDELGWLEDDLMGVMLPDTNNQGALELAWDIRDNLAPENLDYTYYIHTYPEDGVSRKFKKEAPSSAEQDQGRQRDLFNLVGRPLPFWKRVIDLMGAACALVLLFPLFVVVGAYIKLVSPGPVFFRQERLGYAGRPFICIKFRTMKANTDCEKHRVHVCGLIKQNKPLNKMDHCPEADIIPFGNLLRCLGIDELPQLINVLKGDMSLIGPRPCLQYEAAEFLNWHMQRFDTNPGLTGLWQVSGKNRTTFEEMMRLDIRYAQKVCLLHDIAIFFRTFPLLLRQAIDTLTLKRNRQP